MAERQGFEPWEPFRGSTVFETVPFDHSGIAPQGWFKTGDNPRASKPQLLFARPLIYSNESDAGLMWQRIGKIHNQL